MICRCAFALLASIGLAGCSLPGMSFHGERARAQGTGGKAGRYAVHPITPALLSHEAAARERSAAPAGNAGLKAAVTDYTYRVEPQDVLSITVWGHPEFSPNISLAQPISGNGSASGQSLLQLQPPGQAGYTVESDGTIFFPYVGSVMVAGLTPGEIRAKLSKALSHYVVNPQLSVDVTGFHSQYYQLAGAVRKPGLYPITNVPVTVSQALQSAGGVMRQQSTAGTSIPRALGDLSRVLYIHHGKRELLDLRAFFRDGDESQDRLLGPGDIVELPDNSYEQVHLIGAIQNPGNYPLDSGTLNLAQALGDAGGLNLTTANPARIFVFRGAYQQPQIFWLDARSPDAMLLATQFELEPQDVVYVATAGLSTWNRIITQILPTVQTLYETKVLVHP